jgi:predicted dehydrogenase
MVGMTSPSGGSPLNVAVVGLEFGAEFVPIYRDHPGVSLLGVADLDSALVDDVAARFRADRRYDTLDEVLGDPDIGAVHVVTGLPDHAAHVLACLEAGKHVACTVPMALSFDDLQRITDAARRSGKRYMMMETAVFTREYFAAADLVSSGAMGDIVYARGTHFQDMTDWPAYWVGLPPMHYATHAVAPILRLLDRRATRVRALGAGVLEPANAGTYGNPFPVETALVEVDQPGVVVELARSLFQVARSYTESFSIYGSRASFEWPQLELVEEPVIFEMEPRGEGRGRPVTARRAAPQDRADLLPESIRKYTRQFVYGDDAGTTHLSFLQGGGHGGSHPHLVHEFVSSILEDRPSAVDESRAANWTATGIAAHQSAMAGGEPVDVPTFG